MRHVRTVVLLMLLLAPAVRAEDPPPVRVERVEAILERARPLLEAETGMAWPDGLVVERTDPAGLREILRSEFAAQVAALHPDRPESSRRLLVDVLTKTFARIVRAKYGLESKRIHVSPGALDRLPEGVSPDDALTLIAVHEAVHAMDDAVVPLGERIEAAATDPEALRALRMVIEGRAEHYGEAVAAKLGVDPKVALSLAANRDPGERLSRSAGARFIAALAAKDPALPLKALREPPVTTSVLFHPERFGVEPAHDGGIGLSERLGKAMPGARPVALSELLLRRRYLDRMDAKQVETAFSGFLAGFSTSVASGRRVSIVACEDEETAARFFAGLNRFEGAAPGEAHEIRAPDGRLFRWRAMAAGRLVGEALSPDEDPAGLLEKALAPEKD